MGQQLIPVPAYAPFNLPSGSLSPVWLKWFEDIRRIYNEKADDSDYAEGIVNNIVIFDENGAIKDSTQDIAYMLEPWDVLGTTDRITVTDNGDGTINITIPDTYLPATVLPTIDEITVTDNADGTITISLPDSIKLDGATALRILATDASKKTVSVDLASWITGTANQVIVTDDGDGSVTLSTPQDIHTRASPTFAGFTQIGTASNNMAVDADGDISFNGTARIDWAKYTANGVTLVKGGSTDAVADLQTGSDGNLYHVDEVNDNPPIDLRVDFASVTAFNWVQIIGGYKGITSHIIGLEIEITPFDGSAWYNYSCMDHHGTLDFLEDYSFFVPDDSIHINSGVVTVRFLHSGTTGSTQHDMEIDIVALYQ